MTKRCVGQVENRGAAFGTCVHDLEDCLQKSVEIHKRAYIALELERVVAGVPPAMCRTAWQHRGLSRTGRDSVPIDYR
jgi:hypothetical protein